ncbi:MAG: hypothetical protein MZU95_02035 [Desulfomicrobium escambiense]|nr:hypothetical protein [Desulfomicrobium escambiense]
MNMIEVQGLTKTYGELVAVSDLTFKVENGPHLGPARPQRAPARRRRCAS